MLLVVIFLSPIVSLLFLTCSVWGRSCTWSLGLQTLSVEWDINVSHLICFSAYFLVCLAAFTTWLLHPSALQHSGCQSPSCSTSCLCLLLVCTVVSTQHIPCNSKSLKARCNLMRWSQDKFIHLISLSLVPFFFFDVYQCFHGNYVLPFKTKS